LNSQLATVSTSLDESEQFADNEVELRRFLQVSVIKKEFDNKVSHYKL